MDELAEWPSQAGTPALAYHAGLSDRERAENEDAFISERVIAVATVAFGGHGHYRSNVRFVVHAGAPRSVEHYQQEAGGAGATASKAEMNIRPDSIRRLRDAGRRCSSRTAS